MPITSWADQQADMLRRHFKGWQSWYVRHVYPRPGYTWHARPQGHPVALVDADSPDELARQILAYTTPPCSRCN